jgi:hypothetical protein
MRSEARLVLAGVAAIECRLRSWRFGMARAARFNIKF